MTSPPAHRIERYKLMTDYLKHLTTLSTGSILLLAAFLEKIFHNPAWKFLVVLSLGGFMSSVVASIVAHTYAIIDFPGEDTLSGRGKSIWGGFALIIVWAGFLVGVACLTIFAMRNLFD